jgi:hypothetical protein
MEGNKLGNYVLQKPIGQGKFSTVYRALNGEKVQVALKRINIFEKDSRER